MLYRIRYGVPSLLTDFAATFAIVASSARPDVVNPVTVFQRVVVTTDPLDVNERVSDVLDPDVSVPETVTDPEPVVPPDTVISMYAPSGVARVTLIDADASVASITNFVCRKNV